MDTIHKERRGDERAVHELITSAFLTDQEARLVDRLRENGRLSISLVAEAENTIVAHIAFSPTTIKNVDRELSGLGLAPLAVLPAWQRRGVGTRLVRAGLKISETVGFGFVVVLGEPDYYHRFGFKSASLWGVTNVYGVDAPFMALELRPDSILPGLALYAPEFAGLNE
jgi:putative acetyltransferase